MPPAWRTLDFYASGGLLYLYYTFISPPSSIASLSPAFLNRPHPYLPFIVITWSIPASRNQRIIMIVCLLPQIPNSPMLRLPAFVCFLVVDRDGGTLREMFDQNRVNGLTVYGPCCLISPPIIDPQIQVDFQGSQDCASMSTRNHHVVPASTRIVVERW